MNEEFTFIAAPLLEHPMVARLSQYEHHRDKTRLEHVKEVAWVSFYWGKRLSLDSSAIVRGALLHDLFFTTGCMTDRDYTVSGTPILRFKMPGR